MAILDSEKLDFVWKAFIGGVAKTANAAVKFLSNETIPSANPVLPSQVWKDGDTIPGTPPGSDTSTVKVYAGATAIRMTNDATAPANVTWLATSSYGDATSRMKNFIPPTFGSGYSAKAYIGDPNVGPAARIFPDTTNEDWVFNFAAGVLTFPSGVPANKPATIGSGTVSVASNGIYIEVFQYIGSTGVGGDIPFIPSKLGDLSDVEDGTGTPNPGDVLTYKDGVWQAETPSAGGGSGTISTQDADNVNITGGTISNVTLTNVTIDGGTF